jgi:hypothetical protein
LRDNGVQSIRFPLKSFVESVREKIGTETTMHTFFERPTKLCNYI